MASSVEKEIFHSFFRKNKKSALQIARKLAFAGSDSRTREKFRFGQVVHRRKKSS